MVNSKLSMSQQCVLVAKKTNRIMKCIMKSTAKSSDISRSSEMILPLYLALVRPHLECCSGLLSTGQMWSSWSRSQWKATRMIRGQEHLSYEKRLRKVGLFGLQKK
ncbi:hypothetical protein HGM15179_012082 [Zosterops borbonicus]|uniref:Uncharacterized protein n=1 Tax=Zosterops borbonicus TaxID=364589 RepID=A0A8K1LIK6_9PASS|nr:hypothetical protein HGM15179_012082 [Zosterops borbonicus]